MPVTTKNNYIHLSKLLLMNGIGVADVVEMTEVDLTFQHSIKRAWQPSVI